MLVLWITGKKTLSTKSTETNVRDYSFCALSVGRVRCIWSLLLLDVRLFCHQENPRCMSSFWVRTKYSLQNGEDTFMIRVLYLFNIVHWCSNSTQNWLMNSNASVALTKKYINMPMGLIIWRQKLRKWFYYLIY